MMTSARLRQWHAYTGLLIAPSVLFFAITGSLQIFGLHEAHGDYKPAALLEKLSAVHKDQVFEKHQDREPPPGANPDAAPAAGPDDKPPADDEDKIQPKTVALKWFFLIVAVGLSASTLIGVWMGLTHIRYKTVGWMLLITGIVLPVVLIAV